MSDLSQFFLVLGVTVLGLVATLAYWVGRYYFNTDDESASLKWDEETSKSSSKEDQ